VLVGGLAAAALAGLSRGARASVMRALSLNELVNQSQHALVGTPLDTVGRWETVGRSERIVTYTRVRADYSVDGRPPASSELMVRTLGGRVDDIGQVVPGEAVLRLQQTATLFLEPVSRDVFCVTAMSQGHYPLVSDDKGVRRLQARTAHLELIGEAGSAVRRLDGRTVPEVESMIYAELTK
jgi:hypothetical protein